jgi:hypothetical protein
LHDELREKFSLDVDCMPIFFLLWVFMVRCQAVLFWQVTRFKTAIGAEFLLFSPS